MRTRTFRITLTECGWLICSDGAYLAVPSGSPAQGVFSPKQKKGKEKAGQIFLNSCKVKEFAEGAMISPLV